MYTESRAEPADMSLQASPFSNPVLSAKAAGLRYVSDTGPCIRRVRSGKRFRFLTADGEPVRDEDELRRIRALGIPPAWTHVWICPDPNGHIQATGRDAKGRKQYRYHARWREVRDETKYNRMLEFGAALPTIRDRTDQDLARAGLAREKVLATVVRLLEGTLIRVGNEEYARQNGSFGLTTMRDRHVDINGATLRFHFRGKSGKQHNVDIKDKKLARIVKQCHDLPGHELFQYVDADGQRHTVGSADVNDYLREVTGKDFTAKDFRTWAGTVLASLALQELQTFDSQAEAKRNIVQAVKTVAARLGNTPTICRKCYVHPALLDAYMDGSMLRTLKKRTEEALQESLSRLRPEEAAVMAFLQERLKNEVNRHDKLEEELATSVAAVTARRARKATSRRSEPARPLDARRGKRARIRSSGRASPRPRKHAKRAKSATSATNATSAGR